MPTWVHVGGNIGPCWLKKTVLAGLGPFWRPLGPSCLEAGGGLGGHNCKGIDPRGVLRRFEASSRPLGGDQLLTCLPRARFWGGPNRVLSEASSLNPRPLKGIQPKGSSLNPVTPSGQARWRIYFGKTYKIHGFVINHHFDNEFTPETFLESEISTRAFRWF